MATSHEICPTKDALLHNPLELFADQSPCALASTETVMTHPAEPLQTENPAWGFWGTISHQADPAEAWAFAFQAIRTATGCTEPRVRDFLDSRHGRHFADDVVNGLCKGPAIGVAVDEAVTPHNLACYRGHLRNHILHREHGIGALNLSQVTARSILDLRDRLRSSGVSVPTTRKILTTLHAMLGTISKQKAMRSNMR